MNNKLKVSVRIGSGIGTSLATVISWSENHSILWAILHGLLNWLYIIYYAIAN